MPLEEFYLTVDVPSQTQVIEWVETNAPQRTDPLWALVCLMIGAVLLVGAGSFLITLGVFS